MTANEQRSILGLSLLAAFADGSKSDLEQEQIRKLIESCKDAGLNVMELYRDVLLRKTTAKDLVKALISPEVRLLAYEMALGVCEADDRLNDAERSFLDDLQRELNIAETQAAPLRIQADELTGTALPPVLGATLPVSSTVGTAAPAATSEVNSMILNHAILAGALELLPDSLANMAIIPLQMRLVYQVGKRHGHSLDRKHIGEFLATAGIGVTSQVLEGYASKLLKGVLGRFAGRLGRGVAGAFTGSAMAFATTWALGNLAQRYYAGDRSLSGAQIQQTFQSLLSEARGVQQQYLPQIQERSRGLNLSEVTQVLRRGV
jgi:uncharacterized protein (DUF697 family)